MLHQIMIKKQPDKLTVSFDITNKKPKTQAGLLLMLSLFYKLVFNKQIKNAKLSDTDYGHKLSGTFEMNNIKIDYENASEPTLILKKLITCETKGLIVTILKAAGEGTCLSHDPS